MVQILIPAPVSRQKITPPQLARAYGISLRKVLGWIKDGDLRAINAAKHGAQRPRYLIDLADIEAFEQRRATTKPGGAQ